MLDSITEWRFWTAPISFYICACRMDCELKSRTLFSFSCERQVPPTLPAQTVYSSSLVSKYGSTEYTKHFYFLVFLQHCNIWSGLRCGYAFRAWNRMQRKGAEEILAWILSQLMKFTGWHWYFPGLLWKLNGIIFMNAILSLMEEEWGTNVIYNKSKWVCNVGLWCGEGQTFSNRKGSWSLSLPGFPRGSQSSHCLVVEHMLWMQKALGSNSWISSLKDQVGCDVKDLCLWDLREPLPCWEDSTVFDGPRIWFGIK